MFLFNRIEKSGTGRTRVGTVIASCALILACSCTHAGQSVRTESCNELVQGETASSEISSVAEKFRNQLMTVNLLVNKNGVRNSFRATSFKEFAKASRITVKNPALGKVNSKGVYTASDQGTNYVYAWDEKNRLMGKITVKSYKWIAHRGYSGKYLENTLDAFEGAAKAGAWGVEIDLRLSSDGIPYVFHDGWFQVRTTGNGATLFSVPYSKIKTFRYKGFPKKIASATKTNRIPTLEETLKLCKRRKLVLCVDVHPISGKNSAASYKKLCKPAVSLVKKYGMKNDTITLIRGGAPEFRRQLGITETFSTKKYTLADNPPTE